MYLKWIEWTTETTLLMKIVYLILLYITLIIRGIIMDLLAREKSSVQQEISNLLFGSLLWLLWFRMFFFAIIFGGCLFAWVAIKGSRENNKFEIILGGISVIFGLLGLAKII